MQLIITLELRRVTLDRKAELLVLIIVALASIIIRFFIGFLIYPPQVESTPKAVFARELIPVDMSQMKSPIPDPLERHLICFTYDHYKLLARMIAAEARGESYEGQVAVGSVIVNRVLHNAFPNTIPEVLYQSGQFSPISDLSFDKVVPTEQQYTAAKDALIGVSTVGDALFFYNPKESAPRNISWFKSNTKYVKTIGNHEFRTIP